MHAVISLLWSRKFWWYLLLTSSMLLRDVIMASYCCQWYAECLVTICVPAGQCTGTPHHTRATVEQLRQEMPNFLAPNLWPPNSPDLCPIDYEIWAVMQHRVYHRQIHIVNELKRCLIDVWCGLGQSIFDEVIRQWRGRHRECDRAIIEHFEYSWTDKVDFVHICYIQCDLFDFCIFNYKIMPTT